MFLKLFSFIYLIFSIYILFQTKKRAKEETLIINKSLRKIKKMKRFKNTKDIRSKELIQVVRIINKRKIIMYLYTFFCLSSPLVFGIMNLMIGPLIFLTLLFLITFPFIDSKWDKVYKINYKVVKIIEILLLILVIYG